MKTPADFREQVSNTLLPIVDGRELIATKTFYVYSCDGHTLDVGAVSIAYTEGARDALSALIREEQELAALPHAEHSTSFVRRPLTWH